MRPLAAAGEIPMLNIPMLGNPTWMPFNMTLFGNASWLTPNITAFINVGVGQRRVTHIRIASVDRAVGSWSLASYHHANRCPFGGPSHAAHAPRHSLRHTCTQLHP